MKQTITAIQVNVEVSVFNDDDQLSGRPQVAPIVTFQADIPEVVLNWVSEQLARRGA